MTPNWRRDIGEDCLANRLRLIRAAEIGVITIDEYQQVLESLAHGRGTAKRRIDALLGPTPTTVTP